VQNVNVVSTNDTKSLSHLYSKQLLAGDVLSGPKARGIKYRSIKYGRGKLVQNPPISVMGHGGPIDYGVLVRIQGYEGGGISGTWDIRSARLMIRNGKIIEHAV